MKIIKIIGLLLIVGACTAGGIGQPGSPFWEASVKPEAARKYAAKLSDDNLCNLVRNARKKSYFIEEARRRGLGNKNGLKEECSREHRLCIKDNEINTSPYYNCMIAVLEAGIRIREQQMIEGRIEAAEQRAIRAERRATEAEERAFIEMNRRIICQTDPDACY